MQYVSVELLDPISTPFRRKTIQSFKTHYREAVSQDVSWYRSLAVIAVSRLLPRYHPNEFHSKVKQAKGMSQEFQTGLERLRRSPWIHQSLLVEIIFLRVHLSVSLCAK